MSTNTEPLTDKQIDELVELYEKADSLQSSGRQFAAAVHAAMPALLEALAEKDAEIERLQAELDGYKPHCSRGAVIGEAIGVKP